MFRCGIVLELLIVSWERNTLCISALVKKLAVSNKWNAGGGIASEWKQMRMSKNIFMKYGEKISSTIVLSRWWFPHNKPNYENNCKATEHWTARNQKSSTDQEKKNSCKDAFLSLINDFSRCYLEIRTALFEVSFGLHLENIVLAFDCFKDWIEWNERGNK